jgi:Flavodoxin
MANGSSKKVLVAYYSRTGNTARVACELARMLGADVEVLRDPDLGAGFLATLRASIDALREKPAKLGDLSFDPRKYALTIVGTPVWAGKMSPAVRAYLQRFGSELDHVALFVTSGSTPASKIVLAAEPLLRQQPDAFIGFDARNLADQRLFDEKLALFVNALQRSLLPAAVAEATSAAS